MRPDPTGAAVGLPEGPDSASLGQSCAQFTSGPRPVLSPRCGCKPMFGRAGIWNSWEASLGLLFPNSKCAGPSLPPLCNLWIPSVWRPLPPQPPSTVFSGPQFLLSVDGSQQALPPLTPPLPMSSPAGPSSTNSDAASRVPFLEPTCMNWGLPDPFLFCEAGVYVDVL